MKLLGPQGTTCHLKLASIGGGKVEFKHDDGTPFVDGEAITVDQALNFHLYGTRPSSALNDVKIEARTVETGDDVCGYEYLTVVWFDESDLHFRGSDHKGQNLTQGSTALFTAAYEWLANVVGNMTCKNAGGSGKDAEYRQMEIRCQPNPNVVMPYINWDIRREGSAAYWGPGVPPLGRVVSIGAMYGRMTTPPTTLTRTSNRILD